MASGRKTAGKSPKTTAPARHRQYSLSEVVPAILWSTDLALNITSLSGKQLAALDCAPQDFLGAPVHVFFSQSAARSKALHAHSVAASGESCSFEFDIAGYEYQAHLEPMRNEAGKVIGVVGVAIENTERIVGERALKISEQSYRSFIDGAPYAICRCAPSGILLQVNRAMQQMLGCSEQDLLLRNLKSEIFARREEYKPFLAMLRDRESCHGFETEWLHQDGSTIHVSLGGRAICDRSGDLSCLDLIAENISGRKQLEEQFRHAQKLQAVGQFAGGIAHDFNNLLTIISGQAEIMAERISEGDPLVSCLKDIHCAAERASKLTRQLLAFSRRQVFETKVVDLNEIVADISQMLSRIIGTNIELKLMPQTDLWGVKVDPGQMEQVLMNLAVNARDAMAEGGELVIETQNISTDAEASSLDLPAGDHVLLMVRDTGHGMDEATKARIFEPFFTTKQVGKGTGLGLSVVYGVVKQSGGSVRVESAPNVGTAFRIYLPRSIETAESLRQPVTSQVSQGTETILLVEDDHSIRAMVESFLARNGYSVLSAQDGNEAIHIAGSHPQIKLLLTDMIMPRMSGHELGSKVKQILPEVKTVLISGDAPGVQSSSGPMTFLHKPFSLHMLARVVRDVLDKPRYAVAASGS